MRKALFCTVLLLLFFWIVQATVIVYGDSRSQPEIHQQIIRQMTTHKPAVVFHTGDMMQSGLQQNEYDCFFEQAKPIIQNSRFYPAIVNHERNRELFLRNFPSLKEKTYYTVKHDSLLWIVLDSCIKLSPGSEQFDWLLQTLSSAILPTVIIMHHPVFSSGEHGDELGLSLFLPELFSQYKVTAVFSGHDHLYERSRYKDTWFIVTAGGGAPLYKKLNSNPFSLVFLQQYHFCVLKRRNDILQVTVYDLQGKLIDEFSVSLTGK